MSLHSWQRLMIGRNCLCMNEPFSTSFIYMFILQSYCIGRPYSLGVRGVIAGRGMYVACSIALSVQS